ncbi:amidohydrolase [Oceanithermus profundus DSM 14977]|uniref:Amidohydrolase n=1 Tax=Oceanithermus profundus (strain DSM 14977 / NBRC 100410 / VKM B-2274 / 506) TaxID=670487 RepID=E4U7S9_OCEP5|nr:amidohydrolase family protein [Oceanithermus profundus]ADR36528.1 amidohydrolase [Oceanithermus profundus DSM 14977]
MPELEIWTASWVWLDGAVRADAGLVTDGRRVLATGRLDELRERFPAAPTRVKGRYLGPPLANAHTHLDLGLGPTFTGPFPDFVRYVIGRAERRGREAAARAAAQAPQRLVGDIAAREEVVDWWLAEAPAAGVVYWEVLGLVPPEREAEILRATRERLERWKRRERPGGPRVGLSPHAPYSLTPGLMRGVVALAREFEVPLQIHAAESPGERDYFLRREGDLAAFFRAQGWPLDLHPTGLSPIAYLAELGVLEARPTLVHGVQVDEADVRLLAESGAVVVSCPRSNLGLEAGLPPFDLYLQHGVPLALGTDSRASAPSLDVRDEVALLERRGQPPERTLAWAAAGGRAALGLAPAVLQPGMELEQVEFW